MSRTTIALALVFVLIGSYLISQQLNDVRFDRAKESVSNEVGLPPGEAYDGTLYQPTTTVSTIRTVPTTISRTTEPAGARTTSFTYEDALAVARFDMSSVEREEWMAMRRYDAGWGGCPTCTVYQTGSGDFADAATTCTNQDYTNNAFLAGTPDEWQCEFIYDMMSKYKHSLPK